MTRYAQNGGLTRFDEGKSHQENPLGGIPLGNNNSVEENETKNGNFIYSNRIFLDENTVSQYNLPKSLVGKSVADATKMIDNKFKGRNDKISQSTKNGMLSKIAEAQEAMKPQEPEMEQEGLNFSQMALGGFSNSTIGQGFGEEATAEQKNNALGAGIGVATTALDLGNVAFGKSPQDTSGLSASAPVNTGGMIGSSALKGASAGMAFGPWGAAIGGVVGAGVGLVGAGKAKKAALENSNKYALNINKQFSDQYAYGGEIDPPLNKDNRKVGDTLVLPPIKQLKQTIPRYIPTSNKVLTPEIEDKTVAEGTKDYVDWYSNPETLKKFEKNTGFDKQRLTDLTNYGANIPVKKSSKSYPLLNENSQAEFQGYNSVPQEQIIYQPGVEKGVISHERIHAGGQDTVLGPALKRVLGSPFEQQTKNSPKDVKRYMDIPEESYGNFHQFRMKLGLKPGEQIKDINDLKNRVKINNANTENFYQTYDDDKIVKAINTIASNKDNNNINYVAYGGKLKQMADGGDYYENLKLNARNQDPNALGLQNFLKPIGATVPYTIGTQPAVDISNANRIATPGPSALDMLKYNANKIGNVVNNNIGNIARYAPIAANAYQLSQLKKPNGVRLDRLGNRYKPNYVDMAQQQNIVKQELNNTNSAIQQSGASQGAARNAILGSQLNKTKALSNAYMNAEAQNRQQDAIAQQFNLGVDQTNLQQSNTELDINDRNSAAYRNEKSKYISAIGSDIGEIGKEEIYKKIAKTTTGYSWLGKYQKANPNATPEETKEAAKKAGVLTDGITKKALGGYLLKNKGK